MTTRTTVPWPLSALVALLATTLLVTTLAGCVNNKAPEGPYQGTWPAPAVVTLPLPERPSIEDLKTPPPAAHAIGVEDVLEVSVFGNKSLDREQAVRPDGKIALPLVGDVTASGVTPDELRTTIQQRLAKHIRNPQVDVVVKEYRSRKLFVLGEVETPGLFRPGGNADLLEAIALAGGFTRDADLKQTRIFRNQRVLPIDFYEVFARGDLSQNIPLRSGDTIFVPNARELRVFVLGEVKNPGTVLLRRETSLIEAIADAGGVTRRGEQRGVFLVRGNPSRPSVVRQINLDLITREGDRAQDLALHSGDIIFVPKNQLTSVKDVLEVVALLVGGVAIGIPVGQ